MLNSSPILRTANMKLLLLTSVICFTAVLAVPANKQKRDILPGDPRYGTDHHHHHHHHEHENEVQISKAAGGYVGSYSVPDTEAHKSPLQVSNPNPAYGPPNYKPGKPIGNDYFAPADTAKIPAVQVPSTSYGIPDTTQLNNNYLTPVEDKKTLFVKTHNLNTDYQAPSLEAPITFYGVPDIKTNEHIHSHTSYGTPLAKTTVHEHPKHESAHVHSSVAPEVHHVHTSQPVLHKYVETSGSVAVPQVKLLTSHLPQTQGIQHTVSGSLPSFASVGTLPSVYTSYPTAHSNYHSLSAGIPLRTIDHHVHVQVPQPYPVPVTKHISYPVPVPHPVEVPKPYYVRVPQPVQVTVNRPYALEVPRPVPYPVHHYVRTSVPVVQQQHQVIDTVKANPIQTFFENTASTFQDAISHLPTFTNPLENFQNPFENFPNPFENFPSLPALPSLPSLPSFTPSQSTQSIPAVIPAAIPAVIPATASDNVDESTPTAGDAISVENPIIKSETSGSESVVSSPVATKTVQQTHHTVKTTTKEYVQPTDSNGGYVY